MAKDMSYMYPLFPILVTIILLLCLYPVPLQWRAGNIATTALAMWTSVGLLISIIDVCVWHGNIRNPYPLWGDFVAFYFGIVATAIAGCTLCIQHRLWTIVREKSVFITKPQKRRQLWITCCLCFGFPVIIGVLHYVVQDARYILTEDLGPMTETAPVPLAFPLYWIWQPILCLLATILAIHTAYLLLKRRKLFNEVLSSGSVKLHREQYYRLLGLSAFTTLIHLPIASWALISTATQPIVPVSSWDEIHSDFNYIGYYNRFLLSLYPSQLPFLSVDWWSLPLAGLSYFIFFGFGSAFQPYKPIISTCLKPFGIQYPREKKRESTNKTWLDILLRRPGHTSSSQEKGMRKPMTGASNRIQNSSSTAVDSVIDIQPVNFLSFGEVAEHVYDAQKRPNQGLIGSSTQPVITFDVEGQQSSAENIGLRRRQAILERNPELTEEITF